MAYLWWLHVKTVQFSQFCFSSVCAITDAVMPGYRQVLNSWDIFSTDLSQHNIVHCFSNFQTTCRVLVMPLYVALLPTVSHYSMKLQFVYTRSPGLPLLTGAGFCFMAQREMLLIVDMLQKRPEDTGQHSITFNMLLYSSYWLWVIQQTTKDSNILNCLLMSCKI